MTEVFWIIFILSVGQGLMAITLLRAIRVLGEYTERLTLTHQENLKLRTNLAALGNEIVIGELLRRKPPSGKEKVS